MKKISISLLSVMLLLFSACANKQMSEKHSGFLKNYDDLEENDKLEGARVRIMPGADFTKYENIYVEPIKIVTAIPESEWTNSQKILYEKMSNYLTEGYKREFSHGTTYRVVEDKNQPKTLIFEGAISAVEVHYDDMQWYQFTPITLGITMAARATYIDGAVRILGEGRLVDASNQKVLMRAVRLQKAHQVKVTADRLVFADVKDSLDEWIKMTGKNIQKLRKGLVKYHKNQSH
jgi:hypothetical protein